MFICGLLLITGPPFSQKYLWIGGAVSFVSIAVEITAVLAAQLDLVVSGELGYDAVSS